MVPNFKEVITLLDVINRTKKIKSNLENVKKITTSKISDFPNYLMLAHMYSRIQYKERATLGGQN